MRRSAPQRLVQIQFVCSGVSNEHRYSCTIMVISSEEMRINVQLFIINVQECTDLHNYCVNTTRNTPKNYVSSPYLGTFQTSYFCTFIAITSEEIGYNCAIIAINVQLQGISSDKLRKNATKKRKVYRIYSKYISTTTSTKRGKENF